jgi:hypothetical protein
MHQPDHQLSAQEAGTAGEQVADDRSRHRSALTHGPHLQPRLPINLRKFMPLGDHDTGTKAGGYLQRFAKRQLASILIAG